MEAVGFTEMADLDGHQDPPGSTPGHWPLHGRRDTSQQCDQWWWRSPSGAASQAGGGPYRSADAAGPPRGGIGIALIKPAAGPMSKDRRHQLTYGAVAL